MFQEGVCQEDDQGDLNLVNTRSRSGFIPTVTNDTPEVAETGAELRLCRSQRRAAYLLQGRGRGFKSLSAHFCS